MIYIGLFHFNNASDKAHELRSVLESYTPNSPTVINKNSLILVYGKLSENQDVDEVWENDSSILVGRIFDKAQKCSFKQKDFKNLSHLSKEEILEKIWGKYVYIQMSQKDSQLNVIIDSTGQLPFFYYIFPNGNVLFSSDIELLFKVLGQKPEYNWAYLCSYLVYGSSGAIQTPFQNIYELPPACCLKVTKNEKKTEPFWDPLKTYKKQDLQEKEAATILQDTLRPLIEPYKNICVSLSGGLDSSSLMYCLKSIKKEEQTLSALTHFHSSVKTSNELVYARKVCQEVGAKLIEADSSSTLPFDPTHKNHPLRPNKPSPGLTSLKWLESVSAYIPPNESCIFVNGQGGDHIFMCPPTKQSIADYVLERGIKGTKQKLKAITHFYRDSIFPIFKENIIGFSSYIFAHRLSKRHRKNMQEKLPDWIKKSAYKKNSSVFEHPIYKYLPFRMLPGKYAQIDSLYEGLASIHVEMDPMNPTYYPYLYQPMVEFALSFPVYELFGNGYDRYPLRKSISDCFKTKTVWRRDKGEITGVFQLGVKKNIEYVCNLCLTGQFAEQNFIDKERLHKSIIRISNGCIDDIWPFTHLASAEIFLKFWDGKIL